MKSTDNWITGLKRTIVVLCISVLTVSAGGRREIAIPDIPGYFTLKCDFHMHTVFSDGVVWPTVRVEEAWEDGLDAIAITDHIEYQTHKEYNLTDCNAPHKIAKDLAEELGIILIKGAEITRGMPLGHGNAIFLEDAEALRVPDQREAYRIANAQGAYVWWDHPGWRMPNEIPIWDSVHTEYYAAGLIHGIEIVNETSYYPLAFQWALEKNLTILGNSDVHGSIYSLYRKTTENHRPVTLVFVKKRTPEEIKQALINHRTAVYHFNKIYGREEFLRLLAEAMIQVAEPDVQYFNKSFTQMKVRNTSCLDLELDVASADSPLKFERTVIPAKSTDIVYIAGDLTMLSGQKVIIPVEVRNFMVSPNESLVIDLRLKLKPAEE